KRTRGSSVRVRRASPTTAKRRTAPSRRALRPASGPRTGFPGTPSSPGRADNAPGWAESSPRKAPALRKEFPMIRHLADIHISQDMQSCMESCSDCHGACLELIDHCLRLGGEHARPHHIKQLEDCAEICQVALNVM